MERSRCAFPKHARKELEAYLSCRLLCRGFARLKCEDCGERRLVAFSCKSRGFCPSSTGRRMNATAANLIERVLPPQSGLRQWVLTFPFPWRRRLAQDGALLGNLTRIFVETVHAFHAERAAREGALGAKTGAVTAVQRTSSDLRLNPHLHLVALDGVWHEQGGELSWQGLGHLQTSEVSAVLESTVRRIDRHLRRRGLLGIDEDGADPAVPGDPESNLAASAVSGQTPPAGPQWVSGLHSLEPHPLAYDKPLCASLDRTGPAGGYRPWAELLARTFAVDVLACPKCHGRMRLLAMVEEPANVARFLAAMGEATEMPRR